MVSTQQVLWVAGAVWLCGGDVPITGSLLTELAERTGREPCRTTLPLLQRATGALSPLTWSSTEGGCGKWMPAEFRMCAPPPSNGGGSGGGGSVLPSDPHAVVVTAKEGNFYAQRVEDAGLELDNHCRQTAFFHFQEWKKVWAKVEDSSGVGAVDAAAAAAAARIAPLRPDQLLTPPPFRVSTAGVSLLDRTSGATL